MSEYSDIKVTICLDQSQFYFYLFTRSIEREFWCLNENKFDFALNSKLTLHI
jgi:hypothetical protein